jgi:predicted HTH transcriptional regulator
MLERKDSMSWLKSVSAFANTQGGRLLFGVANDGVLVGLADAQGDSEFISETIKMQMDPVPEIDLSLHEEDGKQFVVVEIKAGEETPYYTFVKGHRDAFVRIGNESVKANAIQLKRLVLKSERQSWDSLPSKHLRSEESFEVLRSVYRKRTLHKFEENDFVSFGLVVGDGHLRTLALFWPTGLQFGIRGCSVHDGMALLRRMEHWMRLMTTNSLAGFCLYWRWRRIS